MPGDTVLVESFGTKNVPSVPSVLETERCQMGQVQGIYRTQRAGCRIKASVDISKSPERYGMSDEE